MTNEEKNLIILDLQCKVAAWLTAFNTSLSFNKCPDKYNATSVQVTNLINVLYRFDFNLTTNCLTETDFCTIVNRIKVLLGNCNCN